MPLLRFIGDSPGGTGGFNLQQVTHDHEPTASDPNEPAKWWKRLKHRLAHDHDHTPTGSMLDTGAVGIQATKVSLIALGLTALIQALIYLVSGSVALLSDTLHNLTDAFTAIPLWMAFSLGRRPATRRYTYGFNRAEDWAGLLIVVAIALSAGLVIWESWQRLVEPRLMDNIPWVISAGLVGGLGNELVARYRIRVGESIGSEALVTDGRHARTDALTSLAVVVAAIGAWFGVTWIDPAAGMVVAVPILWLFARSARQMARRLLDGIEPEILDQVEASIQRVHGVESLGDLKIRWHGHQLRIAASVTVEPTLSVTQGHDIAHAVEHELRESFRTPIAATVHVEPHSLPGLHENSPRRRAT